MRIWHSETRTFVQGKVTEASKIDAWVAAIKKEDKDFTIMVDDSDEDEISYTMVCRNTTQKERQEMAQSAKKSLSKQREKPSSSDDLCGRQMETIDNDEQDSSMR